MQAAVAERMLLDAGKSEALANVFRTIADAEADGVTKFAPALCRDLVRTVVCRVYAPPLLELCHLVRAADACTGGYECFFWGSGPARSDVFRAYAREALGASSGVVATKAGLKLTYGNGEFLVTFGRMPFLSALLDFLVTALGYRAVDVAVAPLLRRGATAATASDVAKDLAAQVYAYLKENLTSAQSQRKFRSILGFLEGGGDASPESVDDDIVLAFWLRESGEDGASDFKTFRAVYLAFLRYIQALRAARDHHALESPRTLGTDPEAGEVEPGSDSLRIGLPDEAENPLERLMRDPCDSVRFLTKAEAKGLDLLMESGPQACQLPLSLLRCEVFGAAQARITQGKRRKLNRSAFHALIDDCVVQDYDDMRARFSSLAGHVERLLLAAFHALAESGRAEAIAVLLKMRPTLDYSPLAPYFVASENEAARVESLSRHGVAARFSTLVSATDMLDEPLRAFVLDARTAFGGFSRQGFRDRDLGKESVSDGFAAAETPLFVIRDALSAFLRTLDRRGMDPIGRREKFEADRATFRRQFHYLYGADT